MRTLVIYDLTGRIWNIIYGEETAPQGLPCMWVDIPAGAQLERIDVTNPDEPKAVFTYLPESDIGKLQKQIKDMEEQLTAAQTALAEQYEQNLSLQEEVTNTQIAIAELFEGKEV